MIGIDLFSGCGGLSVGAKLAGIQIKYAVELDYYCAKTYNANHGEVTMFNMNIKEFKADNLHLPKRQPLILFGGPPCQGFSKSNQKNRNFENENNWLFMEFIRIAGELLPDWIVFENVGGFSESIEGYFFEQTLKSFKKLGYSTTPLLLNSSDFGVPQNRKRIFIVCSKDKVKINKPKNQISKISVGDALFDLPELENGANYYELKYTRKPLTKYSKKMRGNLKKKYKSFCDEKFIRNN